MATSANNKKTKESRTFTSPSLLEPESTGGAIAKSGFNFQDGALLAKLPKWLSTEGFEAIIQESIGDFEVRFFSPSEGCMIDAFEAKNYRVTPALFWEEVDRFNKLSKSKSYMRFVIICGGLSGDVQAIVNAMSRIRNGLPFHDRESTIIKNSIIDFRSLLKAKGAKESYAEFLLDRVFIEHTWTNHEASAKGIFRENAASSPLFADLSNQAIGTMFEILLALFSNKLNKSVTRAEIEQAISIGLKQTDIFETQRVKLEALISNDINDIKDEKALHLRWSRFFGSDKRIYPAVSEWQTQLASQLGETFRWINTHRSQRRILLTGSCRLSSAIALGHTFSAVTGYSLDVSQRGEIWSTDSYPTAYDKYDDIRVEYEGEKGSELVVFVQNIQSIGEPLTIESPISKIDGLPSIRINGNEPLRSDCEANIFVGIAKKHIQQRLESTGASKIHLFALCSLPLAVFLGHRLNGLASIQCYEWTGGTSYVPTVDLKT